MSYVKVTVKSNANLARHSKICNTFRKKRENINCPDCFLEFKYP